MKTQLAPVPLVAVLLALATRISWRIRRLRDEAEGAIDAQDVLQLEDAPHGRRIQVLHQQ